MVTGYAASLLAVLKAKRNGSRISWNRRTTPLPSSRYPAIAMQPQSTAMLR